MLLFTCVQDGGWGPQACGGQSDRTHHHVGGGGLFLHMPPLNFFNAVQLNKGHFPGHLPRKHRRRKRGGQGGDSPSKFQV